MVVPLPFVSRELVAGAFVPGPSEKAAATLRRLRRNGSASAGVVMPLRDRGSGQLVGTTRLYSSLNRDAARCARMGQWRRAQALARHAESIEQAESTRRLLRSLEFGSTARQLGAVDILLQALPAAPDPAAIAALLAEIADRTERLRRRADAPRSRMHRTLVARVRWVADDVADLVDADGREAQVPAPDPDVFALAEGRPVVVYWDVLGAEATVLYAPAVDLDALRREVAYRAYPGARPPGPITAAQEHAVQGLPRVRLPHLPPIARAQAEG